MSDTSQSPKTSSRTRSRAEPPLKTPVPSANRIDPNPQDEALLAASGAPTYGITPEKVSAAQNSDHDAKRQAVMLSDLQSRIDRDNKAADDDLEWQKLYRQLEGKRVDAGLELVRSVLDTFLKINRFIVVLIAILAAAETALRACGLSVQPIVTEKVVYFVVSGSVIQLGAIALGLGKALEGLLGGARPPRPGRAGEGRPQSAAEAGTQQRTP